MKNYVEVGRKGLNDHTENMRLDIALTKSDTNIYRSVNYRKIVSLKQGCTNYEFLEIEDPHDRFKDYAEESYIDNTEVFRDALPEGQEPENMGFYINFGKLKLKTTSSNDHDKKYRDKKKKHKHNKERRRSKSDKQIVAEVNPVCPVPDPLPNSTQLASSTSLLSPPSHAQLSKEDRKKLKLLRKEKNSPVSVEEAKSPKKRKKKSDVDVTLDKILMSRAKEVKSSEGKVNKSPGFVLLPDLRNALYPCYKAAS